MQTDFQQCPNPDCSVQLQESQNFCPQCGVKMVEVTETDVTTRTGLAIIGVAGQPEDDCLQEWADPDIELAYKHFTLYFGQHGTIPLRLVNRGDQIITRIQLSTRSSAFAGDKQGIAVDREVRLGPGQSTEISECDFTVGAHCGQFAMALHGHYLVADQSPVAFRGRFTLHVRDPEQRRASIIVEDAGSAMIDSVDLQAVDNIIVRDGGAADLGKLQQDATRSIEEWITAPVEFDPEKTRLLEEFINHQNTEKSGTLPTSPSTFKSRAFLRVGENGTIRTIQILTGNNLTLGRNPEKSDMVTTLLPFNEENRKKSDYISSRHCILQMEDSGAVFLEDCSRNGTSLQGTRIEKLARLRNGQRFCLAGALSYEYQEYRELSELEEVSTIRRNAMTIVDYSTCLARLDLDDIRERAPLDCFYLKRCDNYRDKLQYLFLRRCVTIGSSSTCGLQLDHSSLAEKHARLVLLDNGYCVEDLGAPGGTKVNGVPLFPGRLEPLAQGREVALCFGELEVVFKLILPGGVC